MTALQAARARRAFTLVEILVGLGLFSLVLVILGGAYSAFTRYSTAAIESCDAVRSVLIASELIRQDVDRMYFKNPAEDLAIFNLGRAMSFRIPKTIGKDFWGTDNEPVVYSLRETASGSEVFQLIRKDWRGERAVGGCLLLDFLVRVVQPTGANAYDAFLEILIVGTGSIEKRERYVGTMMLPLTRVRRPPNWYSPTPVAE